MTVKPWIEFEYETGRARYTFWPGDDEREADTLLRHDWMRLDRWAKEKEAFFAKYPGVAVQTRSGKSVDPVTDKIAA